MKIKRKQRKEIKFGYNNKKKKITEKKGKEKLTKKKKVKLKKKNEKKRGKNWW